MLSRCFPMLSQIILILGAVTPAMSGADHRLPLPMELERRRTELAFASPSPATLPLPDLPASSQAAIQHATVLAVAPPSIPSTAANPTTESQNETPLVVGPQKTPTSAPDPTASANALESVLFGSPATAVPEGIPSNSAPWTVPVALPLPPQSSVPPLPLTTHSPVKGPIIAGYYPDWAESQMQPEQVDFSRLDWVDFAFALPDSGANLKFSQDDSVQLLDRLVTAAHAKGKHVKISIGGWTDSGFFSPIVASPITRTTFVNNIVALYIQHDLDGIDIDWEYPGEPGLAGNQLSPQDTNNFLLFLQSLRAALPPAAVISAACQDWPFTGSDGMPIPDASPFADVLDWILIMNYDVWGSSESPGPNAPLTDGCGNSTQPTTNAGSAVASWMQSKFPSDKMLLGIPSYGYTSKSKATRLLTRQLRRFQTPFMITNDDDKTTNNGQVQFVSLVKQGALAKDSNGTYLGGNGFIREWDVCSSTPWLRSTDAGQIVTYDDPISIEIKAAFAKNVGLLGVNMFDVHGDTPEWELIDAARRGLGIIH